ncbi:MAG: Coenzyme F420 hydrogenase/dehydrogenase, beta subunit C-terminal domain [Promethearchaeota archaeon]
MKIEKYSADLESEIIFNGLCAHCGTCGAFCPHIQYYEEGPDAGLPKVLDSCMENVGVCYNSCPRANLNVGELEQKMYGKNREDPILGVYLEKMLVKKGKKNILNALVETAFKNKIIDAMVVPKQTSKKPINNIGVVAKNINEVPELKAMNLNYTGPLVVGVNSAAEEGFKSIGLIGNPCHHQGITKIMYSDFKTRANYCSLKIAVMCAAGGAKGCIYCVDYAGEFADISYSETGQEKEHAILLIRTETGKKLVEAALKDKAFSKLKAEPNMEKIINFATKKKAKNIKNIIKKSKAKIGYLEMAESEVSAYFK